MIDYDALFKRVGRLSHDSLVREVEAVAKGEGVTVGSVLWEGVRRRLWAPTHGHLWQYMEDAAVERDGALVASMLEAIAKKGMHADLLRYAQEPPHLFVVWGWWRLFEPARGPFDSLKDVWQTLPDPLRVVAAFGLLRKGELDPTALSEQDYAQLAGSWIGSWSDHRSHAEATFGADPTEWLDVDRWVRALIVHAQARPQRALRPMMPWLERVSAEARIKALTTAFPHELEFVVPRLCQEELGALEAHAEEKLAGVTHPWSRPWALALVVALLRREGDALDPRFDALISGQTWQESLALTEALRALPLARRERIVLAQRGYFHFDVCPTPTAFECLVDDMLSGKTHGPMHSEHHRVIEALAKHPTLARDAALRRLAGNAHPYRHHLIVAVERAPTAGAIDVVMEQLRTRSPRFNDEERWKPVTWVNDVPAFAMRALASIARVDEKAVLAALEALLRAKKVDERKLGVAALAALDRTSAVRELARELAAVERSKPLKETLSSVSRS